MPLNKETKLILDQVLANLPKWLSFHIDTCIGKKLFFFKLGFGLPLQSF